MSVVQAISPEARDRHLSGAADRAASIRDTNRAVRRQGIWVGVVGAAMGLLGMGGMVFMSTKLADGPERIFIERNGRTGELTQVPRPLEAVQSFTEGTVKQHLRMVLDYCESYLFSTYLGSAKRCQLFLTPQQQSVFGQEIEQTNAKSPVALFGRDGSMSVADRVSYEKVAAAPDGTQVWGMRYIKIIARPGKPIECLPWTTTVTFRWRPDLKMAEEYRVINLGGMQISNRISGPDQVRKPEC